MAEKIFVNKKGSCICGAINFTVKLDEIHSYIESCLNARVQNTD